MNELNISQVERVMNDLIQDEAYTHSQSINYLIDKMGELSQHLAFVNNQMAISKRVLNDIKVTAFNTLIASGIANQEYYSPSLAKEYIKAKVAGQQYDYDLCERCSRTIVHKIDSLRTAISALKGEREYSR